jgi:hypothetical protein
MAYNNGFNGDYKMLPYILQTLEAKSIIIPGITANPNLSVSAMGEVASYYTRSATTVSAGNVGDKHTYTASGGARVDVPLTTAIKIDSVIANVSFATVTPNIVADRVVFESLNAANKHNTLALAAIEANTSTLTGTTALDKDTVYPAIINGRKEYIVANKAKGMAPTAIIVGPTVEALLLQSPQFIKASDLGDEVVSEGVIGKIAGMWVVVAEDMDETTAKVDFILINAEGFAAPTNIKVLIVGDATQAGYPAGTLITGEIGYGFKITDTALIYKRVHA